MRIEQINRCQTGRQIFVSPRRDGLSGDRCKNNTAVNCGKKRKEMSWKRGEQTERVNVRSHFRDGTGEARTPAGVACTIQRELEWSINNRRISVRAYRHVGTKPITRAGRAIRSTSSSRRKQTRVSSNSLVPIWRSSLQFWQRPLSDLDWKCKKSLKPVTLSFLLIFVRI